MGVICEERVEEELEGWRWEGRDGEAEDVRERAGGEEGGRDGREGEDGADGEGRRKFRTVSLMAGGAVRRKVVSGLMEDGSVLMARINFLNNSSSMRIFFSFSSISALSQTKTSKLCVFTKF
jgi:hypothetical protein